MSDQKNSQETAKIIYAELPALIEKRVGNQSMFDLDHYIEDLVQNVPQYQGVSVEQYKVERRKSLECYAQGLNIPVEELIVEVNGHNMAPTALALDFVCWSNPWMGVYAMERLHEVFTDGFSVSDRYLSSVKSAGNRLGLKDSDQ